MQIMSYNPVYLRKCLAGLWLEKVKENLDEENQIFLLQGKSNLSNLFVKAFYLQADPISDHAEHPGGYQPVPHLRPAPKHSGELNW